MNTFGRFFRCTTFGESHGKALGVVIDGVPSGIPFSEADIVPFLARRKPGLSPVSTPRKEDDEPEILSGVFEGRTTGAPIAVIVRNTNQNSSAYESIKNLNRPGHADYTYDMRYGENIRDWRGGGRSSGRETVSRVIAGALAAKILALRYSDLKIESSILSVHGAANPAEFESIILKAKEEGDSVGGTAQVVISGLPKGIGSPVFGKLDALIAEAVMSIGSVKGVEIGDGFKSGLVFGSENNDAMTAGKSYHDAGFASNHCGGILGGITNGEPVVVRFAVKPTPSIAKIQQTVDRNGISSEISTHGRHDPCILPRICVVAECMTAIAVLDAAIEAGFIPMRM